jgi:hypothetical protein
LTKKKEAPGEYLPQCLCVHNKSYMTWPGIETDSPRLNAAAGSRRLGSLQISARYFHLQKSRLDTQYVIQTQWHKVLNYVTFEIFTAVTMKNAVFWDVTSCGSCKNRRSSETLALTRAARRNIPEYTILQLIFRSNAIRGKSIRSSSSWFLCVQMEASGRLIVHPEYATKSLKT